MSSAVKTPLQSARKAGLVYTTDDTPGIRRTGKPKAFRYVGPSGRAVSRRDLDRIRALVIPPAWTDVWICPSPLGHIQATGRDARGRKQYLSLIHISEPTRLLSISYAVFCLKKKK